MRVHLILGVDVGAAVNQTPHDAEIVTDDAVQHRMVQSRPTLLSSHSHETKDFVVM